MTKAARQKPGQPLAGSAPLFGVLRTPQSQRTTSGTTPRTTAAGLAALFDVSRQRISGWQRRGLIAPDRRTGLFRLRTVRKAVDRHALPVAPAHLSLVDEILADSL